MFFLPVIGSIIHYIVGSFYSVIDFRGLNGALEVFKIYFMVSAVLVSLGSILGFFLSKKRKGGNSH